VHVLRIKVERPTPLYPKARSRPFWALGPTPQWGVSRGTFCGRPD